LPSLVSALLLVAFRMSANEGFHTVRRSVTASVVVAVSAIVMLSACSGGEPGDSETASEDSGQSVTTPDGAELPPIEPIDACALASDDDVAAVGGAGSGTPTDRPNPPDVQWDSCSWGEITDPNPVVIVQVQQSGPDAPVDALGILLGAGESRERPATAVANVPDGRLYEIAILGGGAGGGVGRTVAFRPNAQTRVAVSVTGEDVDVDALAALAEKVSNNLP